MEKKTEELEQIKKTKSVEMYGNENGLRIILVDPSNWMFVDSGRNMTKIFQLKRGLESYIQKYYRKDGKKKRG